ncbi:hypothetical protein ANCDUO_26634 [Ancylostoma duodenale]|uniref:Reverse transcriptase domain-containing protein n=1 Tax=Ancylostoma duodenale TaxID=51022 RepID=A0A0C2C1C3_9BILA|nr:hypothetical protein ANCDUO_26634 [Ancylostoma duodenale]
MLYVDNVVLEGSTPGELLGKYRESKEVFNKVGMNLRDYLSNCPFVNDNIPAPDRASSSVAKVFGIQWNSDHDELALECSAKMHKRATKRSVLSQINGLCFDPLGLLTPLLTKGKTFLQDLHKKKLRWDDPLPDEDSGTWTSIR